VLYAEFSDGSEILVKEKRKVVITPVAVEKLFPVKFAKIELREDAL
jgi:hypothetical protein